MIKNSLFIAIIITILVMLSNVQAPVSTLQPKMTLLEACESGDTQRCDEKLFALYNMGDMSKVIAISERMCDLSHGSYCTDLGTYYTDGIKGTIYDPQKGYLYFKRGCDLGSEQGCEGLKEYSIIENKVVHHPEAKITKKTLACENGDVSACVDMAVIYHYGIGIGQDYDRALEYYDKGCNTKELNLDRRCEGSYDILEATGRL